MKTQNRLLTIIVLSIFVLTHILPLQNAITDCITYNGKPQSYEDLLTLETIANKRVDDAKEDLRILKNEGFAGYLVDSKTVWLGAAGGAAGGAAIAFAATIASGPGVVIGVLKGGIYGAVGGAIGAIYGGALSHMEALSKAEKEVTDAEAYLAKIEADLKKCKERKEKQDDISPGSTDISIRYNPIHSVTISTDKPVKAVYLTFIPTHESAKNHSFYVPDFLEPALQSTSISYEFTDKNYKGRYKVNVSIIFDDGSDDSKEYEITVGD